jgi:subtilisin family serine protease
MDGALTGGPPTGRGVRVAIVDSGVHPSHPHVGGVDGGVGIDAQGTVHADYVDRLGHGTAVAAAIREKAPDAQLFAVKVFDRSLATSVTALVAAIDWAAASAMHLVNLSLGTPRAAHEAPLRAAVANASARGLIVVSARRDDRTPDAPWFPGSLAGVLAVDVDWSLPRDAYHVVDEDDRVTVCASGYPRDIPGVARERNVHGVSFAVANVTGFAAAALESIAPERSLSAVLSALRARARAVAP